MTQQKSAIKTSELFAFFTEIITALASGLAGKQFASNCSFMIVSSRDKTWKNSATAEINLHNPQQTAAAICFDLWFVTTIIALDVSHSLIHSINYLGYQLPHKKRFHSRQIA